MRIIPNKEVDSMHVVRRSRVALAALISTLALGTAACGASDTNSDSSDPKAEGELTGTRLVVTHAGGVKVLERASFDEVASFPLEGFLRVTPAGDDRHVFVSTGTGFRLLDTAVKVEAHADHSHVHA